MALVCEGRDALKFIPTPKGIGKASEANTDSSANCPYLEIKFLEVN